MSSGSDDTSPVCQPIRPVIRAALVEDRQRGALSSRETYYRRFPGHERSVDEEYDLLAAGEQAPPTAGVAAGRSFAHFVQLSEIGQGGQGIVYRALDTRLHRPVALKLLLGMSSVGGDALERFLREAEVAGRLAHDGICTIYESGTENGVPYIAMQYVTGATLAQWIKRWIEARQQKETTGSTPTWQDERQRIERATRWGIALADALAYAHAAGVVHRDIKPGNIVIREDDAPVVLDFGLARRAKEDLTLTRTGAVMGTPAYLPPELMSYPGGGEIDGRGDVYSLGVTLYEMLALERPFVAPQIEEVMRAAFAGVYTPLREHNPQVSRDLAVVVQTAMEADPDRRYQGAAALARDLRNVLERRPIEARPVGRIVRIRRWYQRNPGVAIGSALAVLSLIVGLLVSLGALGVAHQRAREFERVAASLKLQQLLADTGPAVWRLDGSDAALRQWLASAQGLVGGLASYRRDLEELRREALDSAATGVAAPPEGSEWAEWVERRALLERELTFLDGSAPQRRTWQEELDRLADSIEAARSEAESRGRWRFTTTDQQWLHDQIVDLIASIESMQRDLPGQLTIPALAARLTLFEAAQAQLVGERAPLWRQLAERLRGAGLSVTPVRDLVPLGPDPVSGLEEFALVGTGVVPVRETPAAALDVAAEGGIVLVLLPGGTVSLGPPPDSEARENEQPWQVHLTPFLLAKHEVTQAQWLSVMGDRPASYPNGPRHPVETVAWPRATEFCARTGVQLPTEAQWEYACRAGSAGIYHWGDDPTRAVDHANLRDRSMGAEDALPWDDGAQFTAPVGSYLPNDFGLFDMQGNVHEWCRDLYVLDRLEIVAPGDALAMRFGYTRNRVFRGASWYNDLDHARSAYRDQTSPRTLNQVLGFRVARAWPAPAQ